MNERETDPDLRHLFAGYDPAITAEPFLEHALAGLNREIRRARMRSMLACGLAAVLIIVVAATTATPLSAAMSALDKSLAALRSGLSPMTSQALVYAATLGLLGLARRRLQAWLAPW